VKLAPFGVTTLNFDIRRSRFSTCLPRSFL